MSGFLNTLKVEELGKRQWKVLEAVSYHIGSDTSPWGVKVPRGFITDFASVPRFLWPIFPPTGRYSRAAVLHDFLYRKSAVSRVVCDAVFLEAMQVLGVPWWKRWLMYLGVRVFGGFARK